MQSGSGSVRANVGGTSYIASPAHSLIEFNAGYFSGQEFAHYQADVYTLAEKHSVEVISFQSAIGIWQEQSNLPVELEPSASIELIGREDGVVALAKELGSRYKQYAMLVIVPDEQARQTVYTIHNLQPSEIRSALTAMEVLHITAGRFIGERLEIADQDSTLRGRIVALATVLGRGFGEVSARIRLLEGDEPGKAQGKDYEWIGPR